LLGAGCTAVILNLFISMRLFGADAPTSPQDLYNQGTKKLNEGKFRDAIKPLHEAVASQDEKVQELALYNLGHAQFYEGKRQLEGKPNQEGDALAKEACANGAAAIEAADGALAGWDLQALVSAYMQGRGARKELKAATEAVKRALESDAAVLETWGKSSGDFKSAYELNRSDTDAQSSADVVDRAIARLVDTLKLRMQSSQCTKKTRETLGQKMADIKKRLPKELKQQCENGEEDEEEDSDKPPKEPKAGQQEPKQKDGKEKLLTAEEAARLLDMLRLDGNRKLPLGMNDTAAPKDRKRRDW
jgi:hypothetical protein